TPRKSYRPTFSAAYGSGWRSITCTPDCRYWFARSAIQEVASVSAGPPEGGLYLNPPSAGGLCEGGTTMPSARLSPLVRTRPAESRLCRRLAWDRAGVGV